MTAETVITLAERGVWTVLIISAPLLILALGIGLIVSIFQATTQIQEQTLAFIPKIAAVLLGIVFFGPWMLGRMMSFTIDFFVNLTKFVG